MKKIPKDIQRRLALACCQGSRQESFVNEAMAGPVRTRVYTFNGIDHHIVIGHAELGWESFKNLKKRLISVGFVFKIDPKRSIEMFFPEGKS